MSPDDPEIPEDEIESESESKKGKPVKKRKIPPHTDEIHVHKTKNAMPVIVADKQVPVHVPTPPRPGIYREDGSLNVEGLLDILGSDIRRKIISKLAKFPRYASDLAVDLGITKQAIKKHLTKLIQFGLVEEVSISGADQKIQYYQLSVKIATILQIDLTPNYFHIQTENIAQQLADRLSQFKQNPQTAVTIKTYQDVNYQQLDYALNALGKQLREIESKMRDSEKEHQQLLLEKTAILNQIQVLINSLVKDDLEKEVLQSVFFDVHSSIEGLTIEEILNRLFLRKRVRAGQHAEDLSPEEAAESEKRIKKSHAKERDEKVRDRANQLLELLRLLLRNLGFIQTEGGRIIFDFREE